MYIKIKHLKNFLLISACVFFAGFNYFTYAKADNAKNNAAKTCSKSIDADCDNLTDSEEKLYKTDSNKADTDGDGFSDGVEVRSGYDPTKPAPGDKLVSTNTTIGKEAAATDSDTINGSSLTDAFVQELAGYTEAQAGQTISSADLQAAMGSSIEAKIGALMTWESLTEQVDQTQIKILDQKYSTLNETDRRTKIFQDDYAYIAKVTYLIDSNLPVPVSTNEELQLFAESFKDRLYSLSTSTPDVEYFSDLGNRLELFSNQINELEVPETMVSLHIRLLALAKGMLSMREVTPPSEDPLAVVIIFSKVQNLIDLGADFLENDIPNHFKQL